MPILDSSLAAATGAGVNNVPQQATAGLVTRNIAFIGTPVAAKIGLYTPAVPVQIANSAVGGTLYGFGGMLHRMILAAEKGHQGAVTMWAIPQDEVAGVAATSTNTLAITGPASAFGVFAAYIAYHALIGGRYQVPVASGDSATTIAAALAALINADPNCPVTATPSVGNVTLLCKSKGLWGNYIAVAMNILPGDALPAGVGCTVTVLTGGTGVPTAANALNGMGTGSNKNTLPNGQGATAIVCGYGANATIDQTSETAMAVYNGLGNSTPPDGCYDHLIAKPLRWLWGDTIANASVPSADTTFATTNTQDRGGGIVAAPGSNSHPTEIACQAIGYMERVNANRAQDNYVDAILSGVDVGYAANAAGTRWTNDYTQRDNAVKAGVSPTLVVGGYVTLQNVVTFYSGNTGIPSASNGYRSMRNVSIIQNMLANTMSTFRSVKWQNITLVSNTSLVTDPTAKEKVRDTNDVVDEWIALLKAFYRLGWLYDLDFAVASATKTGSVSIRTGGDGFLSQVTVILSGEGNIKDSTINFDTSPAVVLAAAA